MASASGVSVKGRQFLAALPANTGSVVVQLESPTVIQYRYQGTVSIELVGGTTRYQWGTKKLYFQGLFWNDLPLDGNVYEVYGYWHFSGLNWFLNS